MKVLITLAIFFMAFQANGQTRFYGQPGEVYTFDGINIPVYDFKGFKPILEQPDSITRVINFWATWCKPCVEEMPHFIKLAGELKNENVEFLFVSLDFRKNLEHGVANFVKKHGLEDRAAMLNDPDANSWIDQVDPSWSGAIPATLITKGNKKEFHESSLSYEELKKIVDQYINE